MKRLALLLLVPAFAFAQKPPLFHPGLPYDPATGNILPATTNGHHLNLPAGTTINGNPIGSGGGSGTVTAVTSSSGTTGLTLSVASPTTAPVLTIAGSLNWTALSKSGASLADIPTRNWSDLQNKPTTLAGAGITDGITSVVGGTTGLTATTSGRTATLSGQLNWTAEANDIDRAIAGNTTASSPLYSALSNTGGGTYTRNNGNWLKSFGVDLTPVAVYGSTGINGITLISPRHFIAPHHAAPGNGSTVRFVTASNTVVTRTVSNSFQVGSTDIQVGVLDSDVPNTISFAKVLPTAVEAYMNNAPVAYIKATTQNAYVGEIAPNSSEISLSRSIYFRRGALYADLGGFDSGSPMFFVLEKSLVLLGTAHSPNSFSWLSNNFAAINTAMTSLGGGYQLTPYTRTLLHPGVPSAANASLTVAASDALPVGVQFYDSNYVLAADLGSQLGAFPRTLGDINGNVVLDWGSNPAVVDFPLGLTWQGQQLALFSDIPTGVALDADNLSELTDMAAARANLGAAPQHITENPQTGTTYTLALTDDCKLLTMTNGSANTLTVPPNSSVAFPVGTRVFVEMQGAGTTTIAAGGGVTIHSKGELRSIAGQYGVVTLVKKATDEWLLAGDLQ